MLTPRDSSKRIRIRKSHSEQLNVKKSHSKSQRVEGASAFMKIRDVERQSFRGSCESLCTGAFIWHEKKNHFRIVYKYLRLWIFGENVFRIVNSSSVWYYNVGWLNVAVSEKRHCYLYKIWIYCDVILDENDDSSMIFWIKSMTN